MEFLQIKPRNGVNSFYITNNESGYVHNNRLFQNKVK